MDKRHITDVQLAKLKSRSEVVLLAASVIGALLLRVAIDFLLYRSGYRYGDDPDTFFRTGLAWRWAIEPYFIPGHWLPLQFWINGATFAVLRPLLGGLNLLIPVTWNHVFFLGSLVVTYLFASNLGGKETGFAAVILGATLTTDIWTTYSGLVEPMLVFFGLLASYTWWKITARTSRMNNQDVLKLTLSAAAASAAHYSGWFIAGFAAIGLVLVTVQQRVSKVVGIKTNLPLIAIGVVIAGVFPIIWIVANQEMYGDGFRFLAKAQSYHNWFLAEPLRLRLSSALAQLGAGEPFLIAVSIIAIPLVVKRSPAAVSYLSAPATYILLLMFAGIMGYGVPNLHARYLLFPYWALIPFAAAFLTSLLNASGALFRVGALTVFIALSGGGAFRAFGYSNWLDEATASVANVVNRIMAGSSTPLDILVEWEPCLYPVGGLENSISRPDWLTYAGPEDPQFAQDFSEVSLRGRDLVVLTNPLTMEALAANLQDKQEIGNYSIARPGHSGEILQQEGQPFSGWNILPGTRVVDGPEGSFFTFEQVPSRGGDAVGIETDFTTQRNACYVISGEVQDRFRSDDWPWVLLQQIVLNGGVLWSHDLSEGKSCGWNQFAEYVLPTKEDVELQIRTVASPVAEFPFEWDYAALTGVRNLELGTCP